MDGIQALMPQGQPQGQPPQMPGQAPGQMPGMQPGSSGTPPGITSDRIPDLAKLNEQMLTQLFSLSMAGQIQKPHPLSILAAVSEKQKQKQAQAAVAGAIAQSQNAQNQQNGTVAQQIMGPLMQRRAAQGGVMRGYAGGGIVAFANGTPPQGAQSFAVGDFPGYQDPNFDEFGLPRSQSDKQAIIFANERNKVAYERYIANKTKVERPQPPALSAPTQPPVIPEEAKERLREFPPIGPRGGETPEDRAKVQALLTGITSAPVIEDARRRSDIPPEGIVVAQPAPPSPREGAAKARPPAPAPTAAPTAAPAAAATTTPFSGIASLAAKPDPELEAAFQRKEAAAGIGAADLADLKAKQAAEIAARTAAETGRSQRAEEMRARATQAYQEALTGQEGIFGPRGLFEIAAAIDPRRGQIMGSLARGATGVLAREEKAKKEARTEYERVQQLYSQELNALDALRVATKERDTAIASANIEAARAAEDRRAQIQIDYNKLKDERTRAQQNLALEVAKAEQTAKYQTTMGEAATKQARAAETTAGKPAAEIQFLEWMRSPENKKLYEEAQSAKREEDRRIKLFELYTKNELQLADKYPTFESFAAAFNQATGKSSVPPPGAVREKGK